MPVERPAHSPWALRATAAAWGFALGAALAPRLIFPAPADQLPGAMTVRGLDAATPFRQLVALLALTFLAAIAGGAMARNLSGRPARVTAASLLAAGPIALYLPAPLVAVLVLGLAACLVALLAGRRRDPPLSPDDSAAGRRGPSTVTRAVRSLRTHGFTRDDAALLPTALAVSFALFDLRPGWGLGACALIAGLATVALRLLLGHLVPGTRPGLAIGATPLALLFEMQWLPAATAALGVCLWILGSSLALTLLLRKLPACASSVGKAFAGLVVPLALVAYPLTLLGIEAAPRLDLFEDGHELLPASEMLRGAKPYRDIVPTHGVLSDGGLAFLVMRSGHPEAAAILRVRRVASAFTTAAIGVLAMAATGSAAAGLLAGFLGVAMFPSTSIGVRPLFALLALAAAVQATRRRSRGWLVVASATSVFAALWSLEYGAVSALVSAVAAARLRPRTRSLVAVAAGALTMAAAILLACAAGGFAGSFVMANLFELSPATRAFVIGPLTLPAPFATLAGAMTAWTDPAGFAILVWIAILITSAAALARSPFTADRRDGVWMIGLWSALTAISYAERTHLYATYAAAAFMIGTVALLARRRCWTAAFGLAVLLLVLSHPLGHLRHLVAPLRLARGATDHDGVELSALPRGRGLLVAPAQREAIGTVAAFAAARLGPTDTWFDFTNHLSLYALCERHCPVRLPEALFFESVAEQQEVIQRLASDRSIRAVLMGFPDWCAAIDGIPNGLRAPLVARYLDRNFAPAFARNGVVFWMRRDSAVPGGNPGPSAP